MLNRISSIAICSLLLFSSFLIAGELKFKEQTLETELGVGYAVRMIDMNDDQKLDIVVVDQQRIIWLENPSWKEHQILGPGQTKKDNVCFAPADIDGDGLLDFAVGADWFNRNGGTLQWITRKGGKPDQWKVHPLPGNVSIHRIRFADISGDEKPELVVLPLRGDNFGKRDEKELPVKFYSLSIPADPVNDPWPMNMISNELHVMHNFWPTDFNQNGKTDMLAVSYEGVHLFESPDGKSWKRTQLGDGDQLSKPHTGASEIKSGKIGKDGTYVATIEPWHGDKVVIYSGNKLQPVGSQWQRKVLDDQLKWGHAVWCANLDDDADDELIIGVRDDVGENTRRGLRVYDPKNGSWDDFTRYVVDPGGVAIEDLAAADLDGDGKTDIVAVGRQTHNVKIYWNISQ